MRVMILGAGGMLGQALENECRRRELELRALPRSELDLRDLEGLQRATRSFAPDVVANCAALTDVDGCETRVEEALEINGRAPGRAARQLASQGVRFVQVSSDYVFDGEAKSPYPESTPTAPRSVYGRSKELGEQAVLSHGALVIRASWLFGPGGKNFVSTITRLARERGRLEVVDDQIGCPTYTPYLAVALLDLAQLEQGGIVHYRNREPVSWFEFAIAIVESWGLGVEVLPVKTDRFPRPAQRPAYSVLSVERFEGLVGRAVEDWQDGLDSYRRLGEID